MLNELYNDVEYKTLLEHISSQYKGKVVLDRKQRDILDIVWNEWKHVSRVRDIPSFGGAWGGYTK